MPKLTGSHHPWWPPLEADTLSNKKNVGFPLTLEVARHTADRETPQKAPWSQSGVILATS